jgi:hypothetical protein
MSHANKMHDGLAADIELFDDDAASAIGKMLDDTLAECWVALSLPKDEAFTAKLTPIDYRSLTKRMAVRKHHKQALIPKRSNVAIGRLDRIGYERQIKLSPSNKSNLFRRRRTLKHLNRYPRMPRQVDLYQLPQEAGPDRWLNANAQAPNPASTCFRRHCGCKLKISKRLARVLHESRSCVRDLEAAMTPLEQRYAQGILECAHTTGHRCLPNPQLSCRTPEAQVVSNAQCPADRYRVNRG